MDRAESGLQRSSVIVSLQETVQTPLIDKKHEELIPSGFYGINLIFFFGVVVWKSSFRSDLTTLFHQIRSFDYLSKNLIINMKSFKT